MLQNNIIVYCFRVILISILFFLLAKIGLTFSFVQSNITLFWLPSGLGIAVLLILGRKYWLGSSIGAFLANYFTEAPIGFVFAAVIANTLEPLISHFILTYLFDFNKQLSRLKDIGLFLFFAVLLSPILSAFVGVTGLCLNGMLEWKRFFDAAFSWWAGDAFGILTLGALLLTWFFHFPIKNTLSKTTEGLICILCIVAIQVIIYFDFNLFLPVKYFTWFIFPLLIWACIRFSQKVAIAFAFIAMIIAVVGTINNH